MSCKSNQSLRSHKIVEVNDGLNAIMVRIIKIVEFYPMTVWKIIWETVNGNVGPIF